MRIVKTLACIALIALTATAVYALAERREGDEPGPTQLLVAAKRGDVAIKNSLRGRPIVSASDLAPGTTVTGRIKVRNTGTADLALKLARRKLIDEPGPNGGVLSEALRLQVSEIPRKRKGRRRQPRAIYSGGLAELRRVRLKRLAAGAKRVYVFQVTMPDGGTPASATTGDNAYQGSLTSVGFVWVGTAKS